jgi:serine/threonine protein kinase
MINPGSQLQGRYNILQFIGQGGMAAVYLGADTRLGNRHVAIKQMNPANLPPADQQWAVTAFRQEAEVLGRINHPAIARVIDFFQEGQFWYLVMEYVAGENLDVALKRFPRGFDERQVLLWASQLGSALDYLHQQNPPIIFRDLKPANVMVQPDGTLKLIDFGIARFFKPGQNQDTLRLGTPGYAAPEQYGRGQTDARSDVYSLGVMLHQLLTGYDPALTPMYLPPLRSIRPDISYQVAQAVEQALRVDPAQRFSSVQQLAVALGISISGVLPPPPGPTTILPHTALAWLNRQPPIVWVGVGGLVVLIFFFMGWMVFSGRGGEEMAVAFVTPTPDHITIEVTQIVTPTPDRETALPTPPGLMETETSTHTPTATIAATETATLAPTVTAVPTLTPSRTPLPTFTPTLIPLPTLTPTSIPVSCSFTAASAFAGAYQSHATRLGCPTSNAWTTWSATGPFQRGRMFWRQDNDRIYVLYNSGSWAVYNDIPSTGINWHFS